LKRAQRPVIVIDEIGSLELERGEGLAPVLPLLADAGDLLLVVRPELVARVEELVLRHARGVVLVTPENREVLAAIVSRLLI
jgi:nucleoside-triphosphatase THEP1